MKIYDLTVKDAKGTMVSLNEYKDKVMLIVNTATGCGFAPQYEGLQNLYGKYKDQGLEILDFPCNQFARQSPKTENEIVEYCSLKYNVTFKIFAKVMVNGKDEDPLYTLLKDQKSTIFGKMIKWNFTKFLIDSKGNVVKRYAPTVTPESIENDIIKLLN